MAHTAPVHLRRLVESLRHPDACIFIHIDAKADAAPFLSLTAPNVRFCDQRDRVRVHWGDYSQLEATYALMRTALAASEHFDRLVLLSGMDLPIRPAAELHRFFEEHATAEFINLVQIPNVAANKPETRLTDRWFRPTLPGKILRRLVRHGVLPSSRDYRPAFGDLKPFAGSQWWALTRACSEHVLAQVAARPAWVRFIKGTSCADETLIQTLVGNSRFAANAVRALTYTRWRPGASSPDMLGREDMLQLLQQPEHPASSVYGGGPIVFARKFDEATSAEALELMRATFADAHPHVTHSAPRTPTLEPELT
ncbi:beta-1,6-N-acetylglucosaminyltransferase [Roseateles sp. YR242]|uniref:beta-1,6-N-acetylglucosaminyltransferase n=1 Tax=Roseateles sp. YR242 TaxID=1855305 RepID=UPI000B88CAC9|nr:beta-1,6-N-acetylglucosaminyltransferase [Roseateles sp. YR242]